MIRIINKNIYLLLIFLISFIIYFPSLFVFYTNDDFFFLKISQANSFYKFVNFFSLLKGPDGLGVYRPLATQFFYFLTWKFFNFKPLVLHAISFLVFFGVVYLIYKFINDLVANKNIALISAYLYAVSATHFGHLYYLATFQELGMTCFVLLSCLSFIRRKNFLSLIFFILGLMSKETAIVTPFLIGLIYFYQKMMGFRIRRTKTFIFSIIPFVLVLVIYIGFRVFSYGFAKGDSYVWDFSPLKLVNTLSWYFVWSLNLPETLVDFIGPGIKINPNLFIYWSKEIIPILVLFFVQGIGILFIQIKGLLQKGAKFKTELNHVLVFSIFWFVMALVPVAFLPLHKFTFYLTLPLLAVVFWISYLLVKTKTGNFFTVTFLLIWTILSVLTVNHTSATNWITQGENISYRVFVYINKNKSEFDSSGITFVDTKDDVGLPWSPTSVLKTVLSDHNFFEVFYPELAGKVSYNNAKGIMVESRQFVGY